MTTALTRQEQTDLRACEAVISKGINTFREVGKALAKIRDAKLYKAEYKSFEKYCDTRWGFSKTHANRLIVASGTPEVTPTGAKIENERQAREYLDEQKQAAKPPAESEPKAVVAELDFDDDEPDTSGGAVPVSSGPLAGMEPDSVGVDSEPSPIDRYQQRLIEWTRRQFDNIDDLDCGHAMGVWFRLSEMTVDELERL